MKNDKEIIEEFRKARKKGLFEVYGELGMGIDYKKLESFFLKALAQREKYVKEMEIKMCNIQLQSQKEKFKKLVEAGLKEIIEGKGAYSRDRLTHAENTIKDMKRIATDILKAIE